MGLEEIVEYVEDKPIQSSNKWFLHATFNSIDVIKSILKDGIQCAHLRGIASGGSNGPYYISLFQNDDDEGSRMLQQRFETNVKFIVDGIKPHHVIYWESFRIFTNTRIPIRTSGWDGEYQQYLRIDPSKFVGIDYSLALIMSRETTSEQKQTISFLRDVTRCVQETSEGLPIYDLATQRELNKEKILDLRLY